MDDREILREVLRKIDDLENGVTRLVGQLEADARYRDRLEALAKEARDDRHEQLEEAISDLRQRIENTGASMRDLPERLLNFIEKEIYKLRTARYEAMQVGAAPVPLPGRGDPTPQPLQLPPHREQTGKIAVAAPEPDDVTLTPAQQRGIARVAVIVWRWSKWVLLPVVGGLVEWLRHLIAAMKHTGH